MPYYSVHKRPDSKLTDEQTKLKQALTSAGQEWSQTWHNILVLDPAYFSAYLRLRSVPTLKRKLPHKVQELILLACDASCTHMYEPGIKAHTANALHAGASKEEVMETLELTSVLGVHSLSVGVPLLEEVLAEKGQSFPHDLSEQQLKLKADFQTKRGYWNTSWDSVLRASPDFFEAYTAFSSVPFQADTHNHLDAKTRELIFCAIDCATTHLFAAGLKLHIRNAIELGATREEIMEVFELAALMGVHSVQKGADVLMEELVHEGRK
ncbi:hypothetical protein LTR62_008887 [Meristemomyces frigidus]|uniref:Carboxymuconolactone decarboxylase-like domain-containing protein n=1 Tax=Meristemomyces frigidus TaxID=1508187 RepID=A0AAN7THQ4_9PEZI|nr:hypothetical protein LTR62_008887 [Meristemomyces frigidus]